MPDIRKRKFFLVQDLSSERARFFIIESHWTSDGPRWRVCDGQHFSLSLAQMALKQKELDAQND